MCTSGFCTAILVHINPLMLDGTCTNSDAKVAQSASEEQKYKETKDSDEIKWEN